MHLASPTGPAHVAVSSETMKKSFSASRWGKWGDAAVEIGSSEHHDLNPV